MLMSESIANIAKSLSQFQKEVKQPKKDGTNPHFRSSYVTLDAVIDTINNIAPKFGLSYIQMPITHQGGTGVITMIMHESGEYIQFEPMILPMDKQTSQGAGSAMTYARRYSLSAAFGIASDIDDDGEATMNRNNATEKPKTQQNNKNNNNEEIPKTVEEASKLLFTFGKHNGKSLKEVVESDMQYLQWAAQNNKLTTEFIEGVKLIIAAKNK